MEPCCCAAFTSRETRARNVLRNGTERALAAESRRKRSLLRSSERPPIDCFDFNGIAYSGF